MGKIRVYELAKDLGVNSKDLLDRMQQMGLPVKSYMSTLEDGEISRLKEALVKKERQPQPIPKAPAQDPGPARGAAPSGTRPVQSGAPRPPERTPGGAGASPASGRPPGAPGAPGTVRTAQNNAQTAARPPQARGQAGPNQDPGPARGAAPSGTRPVQSGAPRPPERTPGGAGASPASGRPPGAPGAPGTVRTAQNNAQTAARPPQARGGAGSGGAVSAPASGGGRYAPASGRPPGAHGTGTPPVNRPGARPAQTGGPASGGARYAPASGRPPGAGAARPVQAAKPARAGAQATPKTNASNQGQKVVVDPEDYRKKALERREEQRRTQEQSQRKLLSKVVSLTASGKRKRRPPGHHQQQHHHPASSSVTAKAIVIEEKVTVQDLANRLQVEPGAVIKKLIEMGVMATLNQAVDSETAALIAKEFGAAVEIEKIEATLEAALEETEDDEAALEMKPPVITVMGHVDHGKTSLLDAIRQTNVIATEAGGITQHIGAYQVELRGKRITFLDTPGHEAFTSMRARGAQVTDIAVLVVAADDGVMPQTIEAINHAKAAGVPIVVAVNKIDKPEANPERVKQQLTEYGLLVEEWGGNTICVPVSAHTREGLEHLLEMLLLVAEMEELKSNPNRAARGTVIDARLDKGRGPVATVLIQKGALHVGDYTLAGTAYGKVRAMLDFKGRRVKKALPSTPVEILGLSEVPNAGDPFYVLPDEKLARSDR